MSDREYEMLDELYFVRSYSDLIMALGWIEEDMKTTLKSLYSKGWIRCYNTPTTELINEQPAFDSRFKEYFYLASKSGLAAHNGLEN